MTWTRTRNDWLEVHELTDRSVSMVFYISAVSYTHLHSYALTTRKQLHSFSKHAEEVCVNYSGLYAQRNLLCAYKTRFKNARTLTSFYNGIFGYVSLVMCMITE